MKKFNGLMTSLSPHWATPKWLYDVLDNEFNFDYDPCPLKSDTDTIYKPWGNRNYINPPYGREIGKWIKRAFEVAQGGALCVMLLPSRTDTAWWHEFVMKAEEIRYIRGRLKFGESKNSAPFPSVIVVFRPR
jgi:hypothetical protein